MGVIVISLGTHGSAGEKSGSAEDMPVSTWERQQQAWERR
jgi:hypothetical protein